jgi:predicted translin family RNA/ssDNA-binding protein
MQEYDEIREEIARLKEEVGKGKNSEWWVGMHDVRRWSCYRFEAIGRMLDVIEKIFINLICTHKYSQQNSEKVPKKYKQFRQWKSYLTNKNK